MFGEWGVVTANGAAALLWPLIAGHLRKDY